MEVREVSIAIVYVAYNVCVKERSNAISIYRIVGNFRRVQLSRMLGFEVFRILIIKDRRSAISLMQNVW